MKKFLYPLSLIYNFISELNRKLTKPCRLEKPVISVGNITWGGSGKTPIVIEIANYVSSMNKTPVVLSRGYARKQKIEKPVIVRDKEKILADLAVSGDEPYMISENVKCPVIVSKNRVQSAVAAQQFNPDIFILDDGFQHWKIQRDLDIVCVNALDPFGNGLIIPAGILREKITALKRADIVILTNCVLCNRDKLDELNEKIIKITGKKPLMSSYGKTNITDINGKYQFAGEDLKNKRGFVLSAIGSPDNFINTVINLGMKIEQEIIFQDHHKYKRKEIENIIKQLQDDDIIVTTKKDAVKLNGVLNEAFKGKIYVLNVAVVFDYGEDIFKKAVKDKLN